MKVTLYKGSAIVAGEFISNIPPDRIGDIVPSLRVPRTPQRSPEGSTAPIRLPVGRLGWRYSLPDEKQLKNLLDRRNFQGYGYMEPNYVVRGQEAPRLSTPNVASPCPEWWIRNDGQLIDGLKGTPGVDIDAMEAWNFTKGSHSVAVAILDSGMDIEHPDLIANVWKSQRTFTLSLNGTTHNCGSGAGLQQINGVDCLSPTATTAATPFDVTDKHSHGTRMAGIVGAIHGNRRATGVNHSVTLIPMRVLDSQLYGTIDSVVNGLDCALQIAASGLSKPMRLTVILASWGFWSVAPSTLLQEMLALLLEKNMLVVCSAFNCRPDQYGSNLDLKRTEQIDGTNYELEYYLPAFSYNSLLAVTASDHCDQLVAGYGPTRIDLRAPGYAINSPTPEEGCSTVNGASAAAALAAGVAALVQSRCPQISATQLRDCLIKGASATSQPNKTVSGRLNALQALKHSPCAASLIPNPNPLPLPADSYTQLQAITGFAQAMDPWEVKWELEQTSDEYAGRPNQKQKDGGAGATVRLIPDNGTYYCRFWHGSDPAFISCWNLKFQLKEKVDATNQAVWKSADFTTAQKSTVEYGQLAYSIMEQQTYSYYVCEDGHLPLANGGALVPVRAVFVPIMAFNALEQLWFTHFVLVFVNKSEVWPPHKALGMQGGVLHGSGNNG